MPTYSRDTSAASALFEPLAQHVACVRNVISMVAGDLDANDTFDIARLPRGARVLDVILVFTDMDTGGSPTLAFHVGDAADPDRFIASGTATAASRLAAGNSATSAASFAAHTPYTAETLIYGTVSAAAATAAAGTIVATVLYTCED
jgi:hypothetical protein